MSAFTFMGVPRDRIDWAPRIDYDKCDDACMECVKFCPHDVFEVRKHEKPNLVVRNPHNCVVFCRACDKACRAHAIGFPDKRETTAYIKSIRNEAEEDG